MDPLKQEIINIGKWIWEKDLSGGMSGNISMRVSKDAVLITGRGTCLGTLEEKDIGRIDLAGKSLDEGFEPSSEKPFHTHVYKNHEANAVVHVHPTYSNGYFSVHDRVEFDTFETRLTLGEIPVVDQKTPTITDIAPVGEALKRSNIVVLRHHGVVAIGETLKDAFFLVQTLEEAVKIACIKDLYAATTQARPERTLSGTSAASDAPTKTYQLFSEEQIKDIVELVNADEKFKQLALETSLKTKLAVVLEETGLTYCFNFADGGIADFSKSAAEAEFVITGKAEYWRQIFNRKLDPFAATTQKKLKLKGDFAKISRWYVPFNRLFELWKKTPVE
ncbi:MAG: class II aldolase/adducin family protein [Candidatus Omnitrophota bacterium]